MKKLLTGYVLLAAVTAAPQAALAQAEPFLSQVMFTAANFCPRGWLPLDGTVLQIAQNTALFSLLGTNYGGNGQTTFALPLIMPVRTSNGYTLIACIATEGIFPSRP